MWHVFSKQDTQDRHHIDTEMDNEAFDYIYLFQLKADLAFLDLDLKIPYRMYFQFI